MSNIIIPFTSKLLNEKKINHGFFTKNGQVTKNFNLNFDCSLKNKKLESKILKNRKMVTNYHNLKLKNLKTINQIHSNKVIIINKNTQKTSNVNADAMITNLPDIILGILTADCAPVLLYDEKQKIIAAIHIGWKGAYKNILKKTINKMENLKCDVNNIILSIGPCIGPKSYEVGEEFFNYFIDKNNNYKIHFKKLNSNKYFFNLPNFIYAKAIKYGIKKYNIWTSIEDTYINEELFFSYRRNIKNNLPDVGRMISTISLNKNNV